MNRQQLAAYNGQKGGRTQKLSRALAIQICDALSQSTKPLQTLCSENPDWPSYVALTNYRDRHPWFREMLDSARGEQCDTLAQDCMNLEQDLLKRQDTLTMAAVTANRTVMEQRRWYTGKVLRAKYGDNPPVQFNQALSVQVTPEQLRDIRARLEQVREQRARELERVLRRPCRNRKVQTRRNVNVASTAGHRLARALRWHEGSG
jgi:terminase small subunit-like protein